MTTVICDERMNLLLIGLVLIPDILHTAGCYSRVHRAHRTEHAEEWRDMMFLCFDLVLENVKKRSASIPSRVKSKVKRLESRRRKAQKIRRTKRSLPFSTRCGKLDGL